MPRLRHLLPMIALAASGAGVWAVEPMETLDYLSPGQLELRIPSAAGEERARLRIALARYLLRSDLRRAAEQLALAESELPEDQLALRALLESRRCILKLELGAESPLPLCERSIELAKRSQDLYAFVRTHANLSRLHYESGALAQAVEAAQSGLEAAHRLNDSMLLAVHYNNLGLIARAQALHSSSMGYFRRALSLLDPAQDGELYNVLSFNMGLNYADMGQHPLALEFFSPAVAWAQNTGATHYELIAQIYSAISEIGVGAPELADMRLEQTMRRPEMNENRGYQAFAYAVLGEAKLALDRLADAEASFETSFALASDADNTFDARRAHIGYARLDQARGLPEAGLERLDTILPRLQADNAWKLTLDAMELREELLISMGRLEAHLAAAKEREALEMQVQREELQHDLALARAAYEVHDKERALLASERDKILLTGALMLLFALGVIGYLYGTRRAAEQRREVERNYAQQLEAQVVLRTEELRQKVLEIERSEDARRKMEQQLSEADKLRVLGQLTGGVAHDFNNLLTVIIGATDLLREDVGDARVRELVTHIETAANSGADITRALMAYARQQPMRLEAIEIGAFLEERLALIGRTLGGNTSIVLERRPSFPEQDVTLELDPSQLTSALLNLALNARDAQDDKGEILVSLDMRDDTMIEIGVHDAGHGMTREQLDRAVEPFYTTKENRQGNGLGLSMVYGFSKQSGGDLEIDSAFGRGTSVYILLPIEGSSAERARVTDVELTDVDLTRSANHELTARTAK